MTTKLNRKLSVKTVFGTTKDIRQAAETGKGKEVPIVRAMGIAKTTRHGESDNGAWTAFMGQFEFVNLLTGESFAGGKCFLPEPLDSMVSAQLESVDSVQFAFDITVKESEQAIGYEYGAETVLKPSENDPMELLRASVNEDKPLQIENKSAKKEKAPSKEAV